MFDIKAIRQDPKRFDQALKRRGLAPQAVQLLEKDDARKAHIVALQEAQTNRNSWSKEIGAAKANGDEAKAQELMAKVSELKTFISNGEEVERGLTETLNEALSSLPNLPLSDVPDGDDEAANVEVRKWGTLPSFDFEPKEHFDLGEQLGQMDFELAAKLSGSRFVVLKNDLAKLERALAHFMLEVHTGEFGMTEVQPPLLVRDAAMYGTAQLPKFKEDLFHVEGGFWLIPTAEVSVTNLVAGEILKESDLPLRMCAYTPCFRSEAGSAGRDTRGMIRQHQFTKVEMVSITTPQQSEDENERMTQCAEEILKRLNLPYRVLKLCTGDMGFGAQRTYDLEVWLPGQNQYREISSCSTCGDFQARRMNARYRKSDDNTPQFVHTLNGSGLAVGRTMVAVLENYQQEDGSIEIPEVLQSYFHGKTHITPVGS